MSKDGEKEWERKGERGSRRKWRGREGNKKGVELGEGEEKAAVEKAKGKKVREGRGGVGRGAYGTTSS